MLSIEFNLPLYRSKDPVASADLLSADGYCDSGFGPPRYKSINLEAGDLISGAELLHPLMRKVIISRRPPVGILAGGGEELRALGMLRVRSPENSSYHRGN